MHLHHRHHDTTMDYQSEHEDERIALHIADQQPEVARHASPGPSIGRGVAASVMAMWGWGSVGLPGVELPPQVRVPSDEAQYLADRDDGWLDRLLIIGDVPTRAVLPPDHVMPQMTADKRIALEELHKFCQGRDVTKCLLVALGEPNVIRPAGKAVTLIWNDRMFDKDTRYSLTLLLNRTEDKSLHVTQTLTPLVPALPSPATVVPGSSVPAGPSAPAIVPDGRM